MSTNMLNPSFNEGFLRSNGEMGKLIAAYDWSSNALGLCEDWPQSLQTTLSILLHSKFPMFLFWGSQHICFYNDAYRPSLGNNGKHPGALGQRGEDCWPEIWPFISPIIDQVMAGGDASWFEDQLLPIYRNGKMEDVFWTFSYSAVMDEGGLPGGVFVACFETTDKVNILQSVTESKKTLEFTINAAEIGTWDHNPFTQKTSVNNRIKDWFGIDEAQQPDDDLLISAIDINDIEKVKMAMGNALDYSSGGDYNVEFNVINLKNKERRIFRAKGKAAFTEDKIAYRFNGILLDITQETITRQSLIERENNFRILIEQAPVAICVLKEPDYIVTIVNNHMLRIWGKTLEEVINKPLFAGLPEARQQGLEPLLLNVYNTGEGFLANERALYLPRKEKLELTYVNFVYEAFKNNQNKIEGIMVIASEVTEQVNARIKIEIAEERARLAADAVGLGIYDFNYSTSKLVSSPQVYKLFGFNTEVSRDMMINAIHPDDKKIYDEAYKISGDDDKLFYEVRVIWQDRSIHWIRVQGKIYFDTDRNPIRLLGTILDITNKRKDEEEMVKINQRLEIALQVGQLGSYELDLTTGHINGSDQFRLNLGLSKNEPLTLKNVLNIIVSSQRDKIKEALEKAIETNTVFSAEYQIRTSNNSLRWIKSSAKASYGKNKEATVFIGVTLDITEHKQLQQQKDDFLGIASHELKTPVTTIKAYSQLLEEILLKKGDIQEATMVTKMGAQVNRLSNLIGDLLDVTKINSGKLILNNTSFNFNTLVKEIVEDIENTAPKIIVEQLLNETGDVYADKERIVQVLTNLLTNAIKYSPNNNKIIVHTYLENKEVICNVQDFGVGISEDNQTKVFEQFYRVSGDMQHTFPGLGLGLYICAEIINRIGGRIWVTSTEGKGSTFGFALPALSGMH